MKHCFLAVATISVITFAFALDEDPDMYDPSTIVVSESKCFSCGQTVFAFSIN